LSSQIHKKMGKNQEIGQRIRLVRVQKRLSQLKMARALGISQNALSRTERGQRKADANLLQLIYEKFDVPLPWLITGDEALGPPGLGEAPAEEARESVTPYLPMPKPPEVAVYYGPTADGELPLFDVEGGGAPVVYKDDIPAAMAYRSTVRPPGLDDPHAFACLLHGDSMEPQFQPRDILGFSPAATVHSGDYACVRLDDDTSTFRRVFFLEGDVVRLAAGNPVFPELRMARDKIKGLFRLVWRLSRY